MFLFIIPKCITKQIRRPNDKLKTKQSQRISYSGVVNTQQIERFDHFCNYRCFTVYTCSFECLFEIKQYAKFSQHFNHVATVSQTRTQSCTYECRLLQHT